MDLLQAEDELPDIMGDSTLIARALANLIRNAQTHGGGLAGLYIRARDAGVAFEVMPSASMSPTTVCW